MNKRYYLLEKININRGGLSLKWRCSHMYRGKKSGAFLAENLNDLIVRYNKHGVNLKELEIGTQLIIV